MKRRWIFVLVLLSAAVLVVILVTVDWNGPPAVQPTVKSSADETDRRIDVLIAELHGIYSRGNVAETVKTPRFWEIVHELERQQARLGVRRSPVVHRLIDFFSHVPVEQRYDDDRKKLFAVMVAIDAQSPDRLIELWLWEGLDVRGRLRALGPAIVPALERALQKCKEDDEVRRPAVVGLLHEIQK